MKKIVLIASVLAVMAMPAMAQVQQSQTTDPAVAARETIINSRNAELTTILTTFYQLQVQLQVMIKRADDAENKVKTLEAKLKMLEPAPANAKPTEPPVAVPPAVAPAEVKPEEAKPAEPAK